MATVYYNAAVDDNWSTAGNWWTDAGHTIALGGLPAAGDAAILSAALSEAGYTTPAMASVTTAYSLNVDLVTTLATFSTGGDNAGTITGTNCAVVFNGSSTNSGTITGDCTFNGSSVNDGLITGSCTFNGTSSCGLTATIYGNCIFDFNSFHYGSITGNVTFQGASGINGSVIGDCTFSVSVDNLGSITGSCTFNNSSTNSSAITGDCVFNDTSQNTVTGNITGTVTFNESSENLGTVTGNAKVYHPVVFPLGGTVTGSIDYYGYNFANGICQSSFAGTGFLNFLTTVDLPAGVCLTKFTNTIPLLFATLSMPVGEARVKFTCQGRLSVPDTGFTVSQAVNEIVDIWGGCGGSCDNKKLAQALNIINACLQEIYLNAKQLQYLSNETITVLITGQDETVDPGLDYFELPDTVQAVVGPVHYVTDDTQRIIPGLKTRGQVLQFAKLYQTPGKSPALAYFVESTGQLEGERCSLRIYTPLNPFTGETTTSLTLDIQREIPRFTESDCRNGVRLPLPHQYAESLLLPLIREKASASPHCSRRDSAPLYQADAAAARKLYGMADPQNPAVDGTLAAPTP